MQQLRGEHRLDVAQQPQAAVQPGQREGGDRGQHDPDHEPELGVLFGAGPEQPAPRGLAGLSCSTPLMMSCA